MASYPLVLGLYPLVLGWSYIYLSWDYSTCLASAGSLGRGAVPVRSSTDPSLFSANSALDSMETTELNSRSSTALNEDGSLPPFLSTGSAEAAAELRRRVILPDDAEIAELEMAVGPIIDSIAPTRASALLRALSVIGNDPRATLKRIHDLIASLVTEISSLIPQQHQDQLRPWLNAAEFAQEHTLDPGSFLVTSLPTSGVLAPAPAITAMPAPTLRSQHHRHSELDRMLRSQAESQQVVETSTDMDHGSRMSRDHRAVSRSSSVSPSAGIDTPHQSPTATIGEEPGPFDDWCCGGESLWLMRERWSKLQKDFFNAKKDRFDLSKIPDIYDQVKVGAKAHSLCATCTFFYAMLFLYTLHSLIASTTYRWVWLIFLRYIGSQSPSLM
jgi:hypothetical protein